MQHTKKYMVVPFVNAIERPQENYIHNQNENMSNLVANKNLSPDTKMKLYSQSLNRFLLKYDPNSFGMVPALTKLAQVVTEYLEKNNNPKIIDEDLKNVFIKPEDSMSNSGSSSPSLYNMFKDESDDMNSGFIDLSQKYETPEQNSDKSISIFDPATNPSKNTRSNARATHSEGLQDNKKFKLQPSRLSNILETTTSPKFNENSKFTTNKFKKNGKSPTTPKQGGSGIWLTKRFF